MKHILPGKPPESGIQERDWRATEEFLLTWGMNVSQTAHMDYFPKNCGDLSEEQSEHFHQDIRIGM